MKGPVASLLTASDQTGILNAHGLPLESDYKLNAGKLIFPHKRKRRQMVRRGVYLV